MDNLAVKMIELHQTMASRQREIGSLLVPLSPNERSYFEYLWKEAAGDASILSGKKIRFILP